MCPSTHGRLNWNSLKVLVHEVFSYYCMIHLQLAVPCKFSSKCLDLRVSTTTDSDEVLRIRLSIVVYDVQNRLIEPINCRVIQTEV
jgi:hypothetical protein